MSKYLKCIWKYLDRKKVADHKVVSYLFYRCRQLCYDRAVAQLARLYCPQIQRNERSLISQCTLLKQPKKSGNRFHKQSPLSTLYILNADNNPLLNNRNIF